MKKLVSTLALCTVLGACGNSGADAADTFVVGMECNYAPFNWQIGQQTETSVSIGGAGYCDGYDVMVATEIASTLGKELEIKKLEWDGLQPALESGEITAIIAGMTANEDREQGIDFTTPYYESEMVMIVRADDALVQATSIQEFAGKNVIGQMNTNYDTIIDQIEGVNHLTPKGTYPELVMSLQSKEADATTAELPVAQGIIEANPDLAIVQFAQGQGFDIDTSVSIGLKEGSRDGELFNSVQEALNTISPETRDEWMSQAKNNAPTGE